MPIKQMSEKKWLDGLEPNPMLDFLDGRITARKLRLLACAACRFVWANLVDDRSRNAVIVAERYADGDASIDELNAAFQEATGALCKLSTAGGAVFNAAGAVNNACSYEQDLAVAAKRSLASAAHVAVWQAGRDVDSGKMSHAPNWETLVHKREKGKMARLVREIFGNPFKTIEIESALLTPEVVGLAGSIYEDRAFDRLPELAAMLEELGCTSKTMLTHCREQRPHYRGCWVIDLLLGKP